MMDLKTRLEVLPCGKCEDMIGCDNCIFVKEAKELYKQIRAEVIDEILNLKKHNHYDAYGDLMYQSIKVDDIEKLKEN